MRISMIGQKGIPTRFGGIERHVEALSVRLGAAGHDVTVYTRAWYAPANPSFKKGVRVVATPTLTTKHFDAIIHTLTSTIHAIRSGADVIHYHGVGPALLSWIPRMFAMKTKVVVTFHCIDRYHAKWGIAARTMLRLGEWAACAFAHETIVVSKTLKKYVKKEFGTQATYVPNGTVHAPARIGTSALSQFGLMPGKYIAMVSRLVPHKATHTLIQAFQTLKRQGKANGMKLAIVGDGAFTDAYVQQLKKLAAGDKNIVFTGYQSGTALHQLFAHAYVIVHPSEAEGLPIAVLEAMGYGKTVIASDIPEHKEVIGTETGILFTVGDADDLAQKMAIALKNSKAMSAIGARAKMFVTQTYNWDSITEDVVKVYRKPFLPNASKVRIRTAVPAVSRA